jgi:hypothetical protein
MEFMKSSQRTDPDLIRQVTTLVAIAGSIAINTISNIFPLNGFNIGTLSNTLFAPVHITPANYAFAIWGVVYLGLIAFGIYQLHPDRRQHPRLRSSGYLLAIACLSQCLWIYLFLNRQFLLSIVAMLGILLPLMGMYYRLGIGQQSVSRQEQWFLQVPISIYLGWISVATILNVANALYSINWNGWGIDPIVWTAIMMLVSAALGAVVMLQRHDFAFTLTIVWALVAISVRQFTVPLIVTTGGLASIVLVLLVVWLELKPWSPVR